MTQSTFCPACYSVSAETGEYLVQRVEGGTSMRREGGKKEFFDFVQFASEYHYVLANQIYCAVLCAVGVR